MCPERHVLSAYVDGEVPMPWGDRVARHLAACPSCAAAVERYRSMRAAFSGDVPPDADRIRGEIRARLASNANPRRETAWHRRLAVPLPLAVAAALVVTVLSTLLAVRMLDGNPNRGIEMAASTQMEVSAQPVSFGSPGYVVSPFDDESTQVTITIDLPKKASFEMGGEPVFVKVEPQAGGNGP